MQIKQSSGRLRPAPPALHEFAWWGESCSRRVRVSACASDRQTKEKKKRFEGGNVGQILFLSKNYERVEDWTLDFRVKITQTLPLSYQLHLSDKQRLTNSVGPLAKLVFFGGHILMIWYYFPNAIFSLSYMWGSSESLNVGRDRRLSYVLFLSLVWWVGE